jgi:DNA-binding transcriptional MocR family regulator
VHAPSGGFHLTLTFSETFDETRVAELAEGLGLVVTPLSAFYRQSPGEKGLILGLGAVPDRNVEGLIRRLSVAVVQAGATDCARNLAS